MTAASAPPARRLGRWDVVALAALAAYAAACLTVWLEPGWRPEWDSALYALTARSMASGEGYAYLDQPFFLRPPGFSWLLAQLLDADATFVAARANALVQASAAAAAIAAFLALRPRHGAPLALAASLGAALSPLWVRSFDLVLSDLPFTALLFAAFALLAAARRRSGRRAHALALAAGLTLAAAGWLRTAALLAAPAALLPGEARGRLALRTGVLAGLVAVLGVAPWLATARDRAASAEPPSEQLLLHDYGTALFHVDPGDPSSPRVDAAGWAERVRSNGAAVARDAAETVLHSRATWAAALLAALVSLGLARTARRGPGPPEGFALAYLALLLVYFTHHERLLVPLVPLLVLYALRGGGLLLAPVQRRAGAAGAPAELALAVPLLALHGATLGEHLDARSRPLGPSTQGAHWDDLEAAAAWVREHVPEDGIVLCNQAPTLSLLSGRRAVTYRFLRGPRPLERYRPDVVVLDGPPPPGLEQLARSRAGRTVRIPSRGAGPGVVALVIER